MEQFENRKTLSWRNTKNLALWTGLWLVSLALATFGAKFLWDFDPLISVLTILLNLAMGIGMILANIRYIRGLDELEKKISVDAMGIALGAGVVGGLSYSLLDITNVISSDAEISMIVALMGITYLLAIVIGKLRYQ
ncbi:hypothetical protein [Fulvivirga sedimenti]|uniref:Uncharacterized protein n=1 Tax=Fulvivirga sedimenti TaxID=2879465 RepID=A0A9X1HUW9_9BACT|nr:hypothetical protein [Fulvivirga sedimenti]MCA6078351.1 hypothetical protein [Fulvivirga sedimenti]